MKNGKLLLFALAVLAFTAVNCGNNSVNTQEVSHPLTGSWKLMELWVNKNHELYLLTDYSEKNIIYEFREDNKLVVSGEIDDIFVFDDFQEGERRYEYREIVPCPGPAGDCGIPSPNLSIDKPPLEFGAVWLYYALLDGDGRSMRITCDRVIRDTIDGDFYNWEKSFIRLR